MSVKQVPGGVFRHNKIGMLGVLYRSRILVERCFWVSHLFKYFFLGVIFFASKISRENRKREI